MHDTTPTERQTEHPLSPQRDVRGDDGAHQPEILNMHDTTPTERQTEHPVSPQRDVRGDDGAHWPERAINDPLDILDGGHPDGSLWVCRLAFLVGSLVANTIF